MPRRVRIQLAGFHHVYNRAVEKKYILQNSDDKDKFLEILNEICVKYKLIIHSYCIMDNHYHLLLENQLENISLSLRQLNSKYASYYNKKYKRVGHLWQDRFKSWFVLNEEYLFILYKYIEANPVKANICKHIGKYKYSSSYTMLNGKIEPCAKDSFVCKRFSTKELAEFLSMPLTKHEIQNIQTLQKAKLKIENDNVIQEKKRSLKEIFKDVKSKQERNRQIIYAFYDGYMQSEISNFLKLSSSAVSKIIRENE